MDIWSDIVCLWCPIGKAQFDTALAQFEHRDAVTVRHHSFELDPALPRDGYEPAVRRSARDMGTTEAHAKQVLGQLASLAAGLGLEYRIDKIRMTNSFDAHRLVHLATKHGRTEAMRGRLMSAYTGEGALISDRETLIGLAEEVGLDREEVGTVLDTHAFADAVESDKVLARGVGIRGVPSYVVNNTYLTSGSQSPDDLTDLLRRAWRQPRSTR